MTASVTPPEDVSAYYILTREIAPRAVKLLHYFGREIHRQGHRSFSRDMSESEAISRLLREIHEPADKVDLAEILHASKHEQMITIGIINPIVSCDLHWLIALQPYTRGIHTKRVYSLWPGDLEDFVHVTKYAPQKEMTILETVNHECVRHLFFDPAMLDTAKKIGFKNVAPIIPAAPVEYLEGSIPPSIEKLAYLTPDEPALPSPNFLTCNGDTAALRKLALEETLNAFDADPVPGIDKNTLQAILEKQLSQPEVNAIDIILGILPASLPPADMIRLVGITRSIFHYDVPALIRLLAQAGIVEVFGYPEIWKQYGVQAHPAPRMHTLPAYYQTFHGHLFTAQPDKNLTVSEQPFEAAACGRIPVVIGMPQITGWLPQAYEAKSSVPVALVDELRALLNNRSDMLRRGTEARETIGSAHTWDHRLKFFAMEGT